MKRFGKILMVAALAMVSYSASAELAPQWSKGTMMANAELGVQPFGGAVSVDYVLVDEWWKGHFTVGGEFDAVRTERFQGIPGLSQCGLNIRQRESGAEEETFRIPGFQGCGFFVECPADGGRFRGIAEERLRGGHGQDGGPDTGLVHELQVGVDVPGRDGESFVHLHPVRFHGLQIGVRDHVAVHIDLRQRQG